MEQVLREKDKENKRLKDSFDTLKHHNENLKRKVCCIGLMTSTDEGHKGLHKGSHYRRMTVSCCFTAVRFASKEWSLGKPTGPYSGQTEQFTGTYGVCVRVCMCARVLCGVIVASTPYHVR